jgi:hypothetical protein
MVNPVDWTPAKTASSANIMILALCDDALASLTHSTASSSSSSSYSSSSPSSMPIPQVKIQSLTSLRISLICILLWKTQLPRTPP